MTDYEKLRDDVANLLYNERDALLDIADTAHQLENSILTRARELHLSTLNSAS